MIRFKFTAFPAGKTGLAPARLRQGIGAWSLLGAGAALACLGAVRADAKTAPRSRAVSGRHRAVGVSGSALGPGDVIKVTVLRHTELSSDSLTIPQSGQINLPDAGAVQVAGLTPTETARRIARALSGTLIDPQVTVELKQARERKMVVLGAVAKPGLYEMSTGWRISDAYAAAGGVSGRIDETAAILTHAGAGARPINIDLKAVSSNPASPKNLFLREGDTLAFRALETKRVTISGDVQKPGAYPLRQTPRVLDALTLAGELKNRTDETTATLTRGGKLQALDVQAIKDDPASRANVALRAGDVLVFTARDPKAVIVSGDVVKPDRYPLRRAPRLQEAINAAGGLKEGLPRTRGFLFRGVQKIPLDLVAAQTQGTPEFNIKLEDGDRLEFESVPLLQVTVTGPFVRNAGNFQLAPDAGVAQAVAQAGGATVPFDQLVTTIARGGQIIPVDLAQAALDPRANIRLQSGDAVFVNEPNIIRVQVAGAVNKQGALRVAPGTTLLDALNGGAGGLSIQPEEARITVVRSLSGGARTLGVSAPSVGHGTIANGAGATLVSASQVVGDRQVFAVDAVALLSRTDLTQNPALQDGDLVSVTQVKNPTVIISGQVVKTGPYQINAGEGIVQLLARAGGATPDAALSQVVLQRRNGESRVVDVYPEVKTGQKSSVSLEDGDTITVPENRARIVVLNAVQKPGPYSIPEHGTLTVTDAINLAGGARDRGIKEVGLLRPNPQAPGGAERRIVSLEKIYKGDLSQNLVLQPGDAVYVPDAKAPRTGLLASLGQIIGTISGFRYLAGG